MWQFFSSDFFNFEFLRILATSPAGGAEILECLETARRIRNDDATSWYKAWTAAAEKAEALGKEAADNQDGESARWAFLRASNYYRASEFFLHCNWQDERLLRAIENSRRVFSDATKYLDGQTFPLNIPWSNSTELPGYLFLPPDWKKRNEKVPVLLVISGFDNTQEELYFYAVSGATSRGYAVVTFEGPGQGLTLRRDDTKLRPDWEAVTGAVLDFLVQLSLDKPELMLDMDRIGVFGASMGGYFALRAAKDPRISCCVSCDAFFDLFEVTKSRMPSWFINSWLSGTMGDKIFNSVVYLLMKINFQMRWEISQGRWAFGADTPADVMRHMQRYSLADGEKSYLARLHCPVLVTGAADTMYFPPDQNAVRIFEALSHLDRGARELWVAQGPENGGLQAKVGAISRLQQQMFAWYDKHLQVDRK